MHNKIIMYSKANKKGKVHNLKQEKLRKTDFLSAPTGFLYGELFLKSLGFAEFVAFSGVVDNVRPQIAAIGQNLIDQSILVNTRNIADYNARVIQGRGYDTTPLMLQNVISPMSTHNNAAYANVLSLGKTPFVESFKIKMQWFCPTVWLDVTNDKDHHNQALILNMIRAYTIFMAEYDQKRAFNMRTVSWTSQIEGYGPAILDPADDAPIFRRHVPSAQTPSTIQTNPTLQLVWLEQQKRNYRLFKIDLKTIFGPLIQLFDDKITLTFSRKDKRTYMGFPLIDPYDSVLKIDVGVKHMQFVTTYSHEGISPEVLIINKGKILKRTNVKYNEVFKKYNPKYKTKLGRSRIKYKKNNDSKVFTYNQALRPKKKNRRNRIRFIK